MNLPVFLHIEATPNPHEMNALQDYMSKVPSILHGHGGVPVATYDVERALDSEPSPSLFSVVSFPTREAINNLFNDTAYHAIIPLRDKGFHKVRFFITSERI